MEDNYQEKNRVHSMSLLILTAVSLGTVIENIADGWEFWVIPLILGGIVAMWWVHIVQYNQASFRENFYIIFSMIVSFYHGIHYNNFFGIIVISTILMGVTALMGRLLFLRLILWEYLVLMATQIVMTLVAQDYHFSLINISRILLQVFSAAFLNIMLKRMVERSAEKDEEIMELQGRRNEYLRDMEDFLVNISHELRTPLNVINGLTDIILRKEDRKDILSIRNAGLRMAGQIEDIQDYSEIQRSGIRMEKERYMITSVVYDILSNYYAMENKKNLEFIVDLDPTVPSIMKGDIRKIRKILSHLLDNAFKFTNSGGISLRITAIKKNYGVNLIIEVTDTGIGMTQKDIESVQQGVYQANKQRNRNTGGIGLGMSIVYGLVRTMDGFVKIESVKNQGTTVRVSIYQEVIDHTPCLGLKTDKFINVVFFEMPNANKHQGAAEMYRKMGKNLASGLRVNLYLATSIDEVKKMISKGKATHIFMGYNEYKENKSYVRNIARSNIVVAVLKDVNLPEIADESIITVNKPVYGLSVVRILNGDFTGAKEIASTDYKKPVLDGIRALVVDDEQMNLVVARGLFGEYNMVVDTAESGKEAIDKYSKNEYDIVFMDHMMPVMDGVEAMKKIRDIAEREDRKIKIVALTANAVSGAKEMFIKEGFDGFIAKPVNLEDFERVMSHVFIQSKYGRQGGMQ